MLYEQYANKIKRYARIRDNVLRFKIPIICVISAALLAWAGFLITKGMITEQVSGDSEYVYGEGISFKAKALFSDVTFEYSNGGEWSEEKPIMPGQYQVRAVSDQSFGRRNHSDPFSFVITQKPLTLSVTDKTVQWRDVPRVAADGLVRGDSFESAAVALSNQGLGQSDANIDASSAVILNANGDNVSAAYLITAQTGVVEVTPRTVTLSADNVSKVYDGSALTVGGYQLSAGRVVEGQSLSVDLSVPEFSSVGNEKISVNSAKVIENGVDVTEFYRFTFVAGNATITKRDVAVVSEGAAKVYDGTKLDIPKVNIPEVAPTDEIVISANTPEIIVPNGDGVEHITGYTIKNKLTGEDVSANYNVTERFGLLKVSKRDITIVTSSMTKEYDGTKLTTDKKYDIVGGLAEGDSSSAVSDIVSIINAGEKQNSIEVEITCQYGADNCYNVTYSCGTLRITKKKITISSQGAQKPYDGTALEIPVPVIDYDKIAEKDTLTVELYQGGSIIKPNGTDTYHIIGYNITDADGDASGNYEIDYNQGLLLVTKRNMTVKTDSFEAVYNGSPMGEEKLIITDGSLASNQRFDYDNYNYDGFIHVGEYQNKVGVKIVDGNGNDVTHCYEVTSKYGTITITPFKITVSSAGNSKVYDGEKLLLPEIDVVYQGELPTTLTRFDVDSFKGEMIKPETRKHISGYILTDTNSKESNNYIVEITNHGTLKITKRQITIITESKTWEYDGEVHSTEGKYSIGGDGIAATDNFRVENYIKIDEVWQSGAENKLYYSISCVNDYDYWECYEVTEQFGTLTVTPRRITVTSASASKTYDGTPLTVRSATATREADSGFALVDEHYIDVIWSDSITDVVRDYAGNVISVENIIEFVIRDENGNDVTANYDFGDKGSREGRLVYGTLTINPVKLTVTVKKIEKTYDGIQIYSLTENKNYTVTEIEGRIVSGDRLYVYLETPFIDATDGWEKFAVFYEIYNDPDNYDVTVCYEDGRAYGYINIKPYEVNISISDITRTYNAQAVTISNKNYFIENFEEFDLFISQRHTYGISINNTFVNAGEYQWTVVFYADRGGIDATKNFKVTVTGTEGNNNGYAKLTINKRVLNYYCGGNTWEYDGEEHNEKYNILEIIENGNQGLLNEFHYFVPTGWTTITDVGEDLNVIAFLIYEENVDVTGNYDINLIREKCEKLIVTPRRIDVKSADATKTYDGTPLVANSATVTRSVDDEFALVEGHSIKVTEYIKDYSNVIRKKPTGEVDFIANEISFVILDAYGKDVTKNYTFEESEGGSYTSGTLKINPRKITIAARSGIWAYDGKIHTQGGYFITSGNLVGSHTVKDVFTISGQRRLVGKSDNVIIANVVNEIYKETVAYLEGIIQSGDGDVTYNYEISLENGTLEVTPLATLTITPDYVGGEYNGQAHVSTVGRHTAGDVLEGDGGVLFVLTKGSLTNAGTAISSVRIVVVEDEFGIGVWVNGKMNYYTYGVDDDPNAAMYVEADGLYLKISPDKNLKDDRVSIILKDEMPDDPNCHQGYTADDGETATESYYAIYGQEGEIEVFKREIVITCESKKQAYSDSIKSLSGGAYISYGELVSGHVLEYSSTAMATKDNPKVTNELYSYDIKAKDGKSVIDNYEVTVINGTLELTGV